MAGANELTIIVDADIDGLRQQLENARRETQSFSDRIGAIGAEITKLGTAMTVGLTVPIVALGKAAITAYGELQSLELGVEAVAGSAEFAGKQLSNLREIAKLPGLGLKEAVKGSINLQAIGYSAANSEKILQQFGNAVASVGKGRVEFERAIYGVTQLANTELPLGEDLNIIADALPQVRNLLKEAFGTSRTEELQKLGVKSKQVMDVILTGLEKLPKVNGGVKNAFENLGDSIQQNLARIGKVIDDRLNISGIIDKVTGYIDKLISAFEDLSPGVQKSILVIVGVTAVAGPLIVALGGIMTVLPIIISGVTALGTAIGALLSPIGLAAAAIAGLSYIIYRYVSDIDKLNAAKNVQIEVEKKYSQEFGKAASETKASIQELIYVFKSQYSTLEQRKEAYEKLIAIDKSFIGTLDDQYRATSRLSLTFTTLVRNMEAYALAQAQVAVRAEKFKQVAEAEFNFGITQVKLDEAKKRINELGELYRSGKISKDKYFEELDKTQGSELNKSYISQRENLKLITAEKNVISKLNEKELQQLQKATNILEAQLKGGKIQGKFIGDELRKQLQSQLDNNKRILQLRFGIETDYGDKDKFLPGLEKVKKTTQKQLAEIFPVGSIAELQQRAELLKKAIETSNNDIIKIRGLDKFGHDKTKEGLPIYTGEVLSREKAVERLSDLNDLIGEELKPVKFESAGFLDPLGNEYKTLADLLQSQATRLYDITNHQIPKTFDDGFVKTLEQSAKISQLKEQLNKDFEGLISSSVASTLTDTFDSIGQAIAQGGNVMQSIGNSLLKGISNFLKKMGEMLIQYGVLTLIKGKLDIASKVGGPTAIAAGLAAIGIGAAASAVGSAIGSFAGSGGNGSSNTNTTSSASNVPNYTSSTYSNGTSSGGDVIFRISGNDLIGAINRNVSAENRLN